MVKSGKMHHEMAGFGSVSLEEGSYLILEQDAHWKVLQIHQQKTLMILINSCFLLANMALAKPTTQGMELNL